MKQLIIILIIILIPICCMADQSAITNVGDEVILYDDGTWKYLDKDTEIKQSMPINNIKFNKGKKLSFLLKSKRNNVGLWIDPKKWSFKKAVNNEEAEYEFVLKGQDLYGMIITEKAVIAIEGLAEIAFETAQNRAKDMKLIHKEYRIVNGNKVIQMQMEGTFKGIKVAYYGYYFSNQKGTTQILAYTTQGLFDSYRETIIDFLNGFVVN